MVDITAQTYSVKTYTNMPMPTKEKIMGVVDKALRICEHSFVFAEMSGAMRSIWICQCGAWKIVNHNNAQLLKE